MKNKKTFLKFLIIFAFSLFLLGNKAFADDIEKFDKIYEELEPANFEYIFGIDPYQAEDYTKYMFSPYPLFRVGTQFIFKNTVIDPGYYLLTPRKKDGKTYMLFKEQGRVKYLIPVYEVDLVSPTFYDQYMPEPKRGRWRKICDGTMNTIGRKFPKKTQRMPAPKAYIEVNDIDRIYWQIILYYGEQKYYMIFRQR